MLLTEEATESRTGWLIENLASLALALFIVFVIRSSFFEAFKIPSGSMMPTLLTGDHIFVNKFHYGLKVPFSDWLSSKGPIYLVRRPPPLRGDIIVFEYPKDERVFFIKRVIGVPGDRIEIRNKTLFINQQKVDRSIVTGPIAEKVFRSFDEPKYSANSLEIFEEHLSSSSPATVNHQIMLDKTNFTIDSFGPITVPADSLFVMGDNRDFSNDSRYWGFVPFKNVKGKAMVIWLSLWVNITDGQFIFRPDRVGTVLH